MSNGEMPGRAAELLSTDAFSQLVIGEADYITRLCIAITEGTHLVGDLRTTIAEKGIEDLHLCVSLGAEICVIAKGWDFYEQGLRPLGEFTIEHCTEPSESSLRSVELQFTQAGALTSVQIYEYNQATDTGMGVRLARYIPERLSYDISDVPNVQEDSDAQTTETTGDKATPITQLVEETEKFLIAMTTRLREETTDHVSLCLSEMIMAAEKALGEAASITILDGDQNPALTLENPSGPETDDDEPVTTEAARELAKRIIDVLAESSEIRPITWVNQAQEAELIGAISAANYKINDELIEIKSDRIVTAAGHYSKLYIVTVTKPIVGAEEALESVRYEVSEDGLMSAVEEYSDPIDDEPETSPTDIMDADLLNDDIHVLKMSHYREAMRALNKCHEHPEYRIA